MTSKLLQKYIHLNEESEARLNAAMKHFDLSARAYERILKVARTIADLAGSETIESLHIAEAIGYRNLDRGDWAERGR
jgi:magnesium chelatase family protein